MNTKKILSITSYFFFNLFVSVLIFNSVSISVKAQALREPPHFELTILHTNDLHSHFEGSGPDAYYTSKVGDRDPIKGHYARLAHQIREIRKKTEAPHQGVLLVDSGDFFAGTLFHVLAPSPKTKMFPELEFFKKVGYDAFILGNHEFDPGEFGLDLMLKKAETQNLNAQFVASNLYLKSPNSPLKSFIHKTPKFLLKEYTAPNFKFRIGILGILGIDAAKVSSVNRPTVAVYGYHDADSSEDWEELFQQTQSQVDHLRLIEKVDFVLVLFHGGGGEDEKLARNVKGIDLISAGHTHEVYQEPKIINNTYIVQAGSFGAQLGRINFKILWPSATAFNSTPASRESQKLGPATVSFQNSEQILIDDQTPSAPDILHLIQTYKSEIPKSYDQEFKYETPIASFNQSFKGRNEPNDPLGIFIASALLRELNKISKSPIDLYMTTTGLIREDFIAIPQPRTTYQFSDFFRMLSIGFNKQQPPTAGSPIVSFYMKPNELIQLMNFMEIYRFISPNFVAAYSKSITYEIRPWGIPFLNRLKNPKLNSKAPEEWSPLIHVSTNEYVAQFLPLIQNLSHGIVSLYYRDRNGLILSQPYYENSPTEAILFARSFKDHSLPPLSNTMIKKND